MPRPAFALAFVEHQNIDAYVQLGFDPTIYELGSALTEAHHDPAIPGKHWMNREEAFIQASVTPSA